eukprot:CAMPEP_0181123316 /NCGR_PEP_ID=MMETSP1071-20121207/25830_1 /TAXON_ID=35127 /ORGANISM="Thalassiosira sp., Strain NH16" /LENGTH=310 /DNA_ID=CAMNT_0023208441 /DNA_START=356 /DNA_END=1288 /DNA_ORIENTATION=+
MARSRKDDAIVRASTQHYYQHVNMIHAAFDRIAQNERPPKRILFSGDSLLRQLFISIGCNALSWPSFSPSWNGKNLVEHAEIPWKDEWPCSKNFCIINHGSHGGFDAASIRLVNGMELHFVPHMGFKDDFTSETNILERLHQDIEDYGRITFGKKTAMPPGGPHVDVLVFNVGIHHSNLYQAQKKISNFANWIAKPLMKLRNLNELNDGHSPTQTIYVTTPTQHYNTSNGQWHHHMTPEDIRCVDEIQSNPQAELEKELLTPGVNVDVLLDYDDLNLGGLHVRKGSDCSHYCMPGVPDVVAARLMEAILL